MSTTQVSSDGRQSVRQICKLVFNDGGVVTGQISALSRYDDCVVDYSGDVDRLPFLFETADSVLLRVYFQNFARELKAQFREDTIGEWPAAQFFESRLTRDQPEGAIVSKG